MTKFDRTIIAAMLSGSSFLVTLGLVDIASAQGKAVAAKVSIKKLPADVTAALADLAKLLK